LHRFKPILKLIITIIIAVWCVETGNILWFFTGLMIFSIVKRREFFKHYILMWYNMIKSELLRDSAGDGNQQNLGGIKPTPDNHNKNKPNNDV
jgi:hypothetical protein